VILDYVKTLIWPLTILVCVLVIGWRYRH